jgi:hypothetical protein
MCNQSVLGELEKYKLNLAAGQEVRWEGERYQIADNYTFFYEKVTGFFIHNRIISPVKRVEFVSDSMSDITLKGHWCDIVLNVHAPTDDKDYDLKNNFRKELEQVFDMLPRYHMKILLRDFTAKGGRTS